VAASAAAGLIRLEAAADGAEVEVVVLEPFPKI
jgi:hypothetical protein